MFEFILIFFLLLYGWKIPKWPIIRFLIDAVRFRFFVCWYLMESMMPCMHLNKMFWTSGRNIGPQNYKSSSIFNRGHGVLFFTPVCTKLIWWVCCQKANFQFHLNIEASDIWSSSRVWQLNSLEFVFGLVRRLFLDTLLNNMWWCKDVWLFTILQLWSLESL